MFLCLCSDWFCGFDLREGSWFLSLYEKSCEVCICLWQFDSPEVTLCGKLVCMTPSVQTAEWSWCSTILQRTCRPCITDWNCRHGCWWRRIRPVPRENHHHRVPGWFGPKAESWVVAALEACLDLQFPAYAVQTADEFLDLQFHAKKCPAFVVGDWWKACLLLWVHSGTITKSQFIPLCFTIPVQLVNSMVTKYIDFLSDYMLYDTHLILTITDQYLKDLGIRKVVACCPVQIHSTILLHIQNLKHGMSNNILLPHTTDRGALWCMWWCV